MLSNTVKIIAGIIVLMAFLGCSQNRNVFMGESYLDKNWGRAYETAKHNQIINHDAGKDVQIKWYFEEGDESIQELGQHYEQTIQIPFEHIEYY